MNRRSSIKPRFLGQPLWWWLGKPHDWPEDLFGPRPDPHKNHLRRGLYRVGTIYRRAKGVRPRPVSAWKAFYARGRDGYSIPDTWNLCGYLCSWMPEALRHMADVTHGYPVGIANQSMRALVLDGVPSDDAAFEAWKQTLRTMARGFEAGKEILDMDYYDTEDSKENNDARYEALMAEFNTGMDNFKEWFFAIWD